MCYIVCTVALRKYYWHHYQSLQSLSVHHYESFKGTPVEADPCCFLAETETWAAGVVCVCMWLCAFADRYPSVY